MSDDENSEEYEVEKIIFHQVIGNEIVYFIQWKNCELNLNTWEPEEHLVNCSEILKEYKSKNNLFKKKR
ncbi:chromobox protein homolog 5-like [Myzus persicae]|uniref:chromobox protein homolog 5-like n=1 Tax=Myzus persicae TaxID=13164 RepID=UPI000B9354F8|nr:chromobox protein homolog 5-like [Myzus persicae]